MVDEVGSTESEGGFETGMIFGAWGMREKMTDGPTQNFGAGSLGAWGLGGRRRRRRRQLRRRISEPRILEPGVKTTTKKKKSGA